MAFLGGGFALLQWRKNNALQRAKFLYELYEKYQEDRDIADAFYLIIYNKDWNKKEYRNSENEFIIDKLIVWLTHICYLIETGSISQKEISIVNYTLYCVCKSKQIQLYLKRFHYRSKKMGIECTYNYLIKFGIKNQLLCEKDFK